MLQKLTGFIETREACFQSFARIAHGHRHCTTVKTKCGVSSCEQWPQSSDLFHIAVMLQKLTVFIETRNLATEFSPRLGTAGISKCITTKLRPWHPAVYRRVKYQWPES